MSDVVVLGVIVFGLLHGINPSHGWIIAMMYSIKSRNPLLSGLVSSSMIAGAHFVSSIVVVIAFLLLVTFVEIPSEFLQYGAAIGLGILAIIFWREKSEDLVDTQHGHLHDNTSEIEHEHMHWHKGIGYHTHAHTHQSRTLPSLKGMAAFALILGFVHEEEFVILSLSAGGVEPLLLMLTYASSVTLAMIGITMGAIKAFTKFQYKFIHYSKYFSKITAVILAVMAVGFAVGIF